MLGEVTAFFLESQVFKNALSSMHKALINSILKRLGEQTVENPLSTANLRKWCAIQIVGIICVMSQLGLRPKTEALNPVGIMHWRFCLDFQLITLS